MMTSDYPDPSFSGDFLPVERVSVARGTLLLQGCHTTRVLKS